MKKSEKVFIDRYKLRQIDRDRQIERVRQKKERERNNESE